MAQVELHIRELILRGLPHGQRYRVASAVEAELKRLVDEGGVPPSLAAGGMVPQVQVDDLRLEAGAKPGALGRQIAASIYSSLGGTEPQPGLPGRSTQ